MFWNSSALECLKILKQKDIRTEYLIIWTENKLSKKKY